LKKRFLERLETMSNRSLLFLLLLVLGVFLAVKFDLPTKVTIGGCKYNN
jgi:hypothetical protein